MSLNSIEEIIEDMRQGRMVIIMDDEDRENEGDLLLAASAAMPEDINFMARYGRGLICLTLTQQRCEQLQLPLMVSRNTAQLSTNFTVSIEAAKGVTTGISAGDRAVTVQTAVADGASAEDIVQPGHIFPLMAQPGGVLTRAGHTEAGCDLARLAGLEPASVIVEILNEDGSMARRPDLEKFAKQHDLKIGTIADLIHYRLRNETTVERVAENTVTTDFGDFKLVAYHDQIDQMSHFALVRGQIESDRDTLVRVHMHDGLVDLLDLHGQGGSWPLREAMQYIAGQDNGVIVILRTPDNQQGLIDRVLKMGNEQQKSDKASGDEPLPELRTFGVGAQILSDLGVNRMRVMSSPVIMHGLSGFDLEVVEYVHSSNE